jgi:Probable cobalt transporter subunit (CbtB)
VSADASVGVSQILRHHAVQFIRWGRIHPFEGGTMSTASAPAAGGSQVGVSPQAISRTRVIVVLGITIFLALLAYYFVGVDEGMSSVFGKSMVVHEWVHDSRHFLGFPCH